MGFLVLLVASYLSVYLYFIILAEYKLKYFQGKCAEIMKDHRIHIKNFGSNNRLAKRINVDTIYELTREKDISEKETKPVNTDRYQDIIDLTKK